jgi:hypothetical protein
VSNKQSKTKSIAVTRNLQSQQGRSARAQAFVVLNYELDEVTSRPITMDGTVNKIVV